MPRPTAGQTGQKRQRSKKAMPKKAADAAVRAVSDMPDTAFVRLTCNYPVCHLFHLTIFQSFTHFCALLLYHSESAAVHHDFVKWKLEKRKHARTAATAEHRTAALYYYNRETSYFFRRNSPATELHSGTARENPRAMYSWGRVSITVEKMTRSMGKTTAAASTARETATAPMSHRLFP